jgi:ribonuclease E
VLDEDKTNDSTVEAPASTSDEGAAAPAKRATAKKTTAKKTAAKKATTRKTAAKKSAAPSAGEPTEAAEVVAPDAPVAKKTTSRKTAAKKAAATSGTEVDGPVEAAPEPAPEPPPTMLLFQPPDPTKAATRRPRRAVAKPAAEPAAEPADEPAHEDTTGPADTSQRRHDTEDRGVEAGIQPDETDSSDDTDDTDENGVSRRRRRRGGRRRRKSGEGDDLDESTDDSDRTGQEADSRDAGGSAKADASSDTPDESGEGTGSRRRRRRRRPGDDGVDTGDDPDKTVTRVRRTRTGDDQITAVSGSTRLEAKKQRRREGREAGRRRAPIVSEAEFLARRESVERVMVIRQREDLTQIAVLEDKVLVEHYVARESQTSLIGNVYVGRVQNVLPSMEAAFIDIGKGRNAVLYAGEVNWSALGQRDSQPRKIESVLSSGQSVLVQVTKDPMGHKGARLTSQVSLAGRFLVYVPDGTTSGISRKLPDTERTRLKTLLKEIVPDTAGVIVRTAAEGASEEELTHDVERLKARWEDIEKNSKSGSAPKLLYGEPDLTLKVVRDLFTEDFTRLVIEGDDAWDTVQQYVVQVAPDLEPRLERYDRGQGGGDAFSSYRIDEQIAKGLDRKVWLPSGGSLVIDRTEAMTVVDVNTGKFTGSGGNLEETVTKNNLEAAEEIVRQLRLRDIGGIIVVDFIDMVLESNRDLVMRRLVECLGRDRTRHQVAEVTSLGLVQMTRKRIGTGLLEAFSENCEHCQGRGVIIHDAPIEDRGSDDDSRRGGRRSRGRGRDTGTSSGNGNAAPKLPPSPKVLAGSHPPAEPEEESVEAPEPESEPTVEPTVEHAVEPDAVPVEPAETPEVAVPQDWRVEVVETTPEPAPVVEGPRVVTRTRRRSASRPAGPPSAAISTNGAAATSGTVGTIGAPATDGLVEPDDGYVEPGTSDGSGHMSEDGAHPELHVPIKKKGSRKR